MRQAVQGCGGSMVFRTQEPSISPPALLLCDFLSKLAQWCKMAAGVPAITSYSRQLGGEREEKHSHPPLQGKSLEALNLTSTSLSLSRT